MYSVCHDLVELPGRSGEKGGASTCLQKRWVSGLVAALIRERSWLLGSMRRRRSGRLREPQRSLTACWSPRGRTMERALGEADGGEDLGEPRAELGIGDDFKEVAVMGKPEVLC